MNDLSVRVYTPESKLKNPRVLFQSMWHDLLESRELAWRLLVRDISAQYRQSILGIVWAFIPPAFLAAGLLMARSANVINIGETDLPYAAYVMLSMVLWQTFTESLMAPITALQQSKAMLAKINFPREALILAKVGEVLFNFTIKLILVIGLFVWFQLNIGWTILLAPFALLTLIAFGFFLGALLAPLGALYNDISKGLTVITGFWLFLTPVVYPPPTAGIFGLIVNLNPVTHLLVTTRELATAVPVSHLTGFLVSMLITWTGLLLAWVTLRIAMPFVIERMSA
ncbi:MAG: ABC transporter permease [Bacteroidetes bacterium]|nr:ABC transporter permease [Bacteroidota bacterium]